jgi:phosphatidylglycerol lysyltransferase
MALGDAWTTAPGRVLGLTLLLPLLGLARGLVALRHRPAGRPAAAQALPLALVARLAVGRVAGAALAAAADRRVVADLVPAAALARADRVDRFSQGLVAGLVPALALLAVPAAFPGGGEALPSASRVIAVPALLVAGAWGLWLLLGRDQAGDAAGDPAGDGAEGAGAGSGAGPVAPAWRLLLPVAALLALALIEILVFASLLRLLLPAAAAVPPLAFVAWTAVAAAAGRASGVPAGLGVADAVLVLLLATMPGGPAPAAVLGALAAARLLALVLPVVVLAIAAARLDRGQAGTAGWRRRPLACLAWRMRPPLLAALALTAGLALVGWALLPGPPAAAAVAAAAGSGLVLLARGIDQRLAAARRLAIACLAAGTAAAAAAQALPLAVALAAVILLLATARRSLGRPAPLPALALPRPALALPAPPLLTLLAAAAAAAEAGDAIAATVAAAGVLPAAGLLCLGRAGRAPPTAAAAAAAAALGPLATTLLPAGGRFALPPGPGPAFAVADGCWIVPGDPAAGRGAPRPSTTNRAATNRAATNPACDPDRAGDGEWALVEAARRAAARPLFVAVAADTRSLHADLGLDARPIGDAARVLLPAFSLDGRQRLPLRRTCERLRQMGASLEVLDGSGAGAGGDGFLAIDRAWRLARRPLAAPAPPLAPLLAAAAGVAVVRVADRAVACAPLWIAADGAGLAATAVRFIAESPADVLDFLLAELMAWGRRRGFAWFDLGLAPLPDGPAPAMPPAVFLHGEHFAHVPAIRRWKAQFAPEWGRCYLTRPGGDLGRDLAAIARLADRIARTGEARPTPAATAAAAQGGFP